MNLEQLAQQCDVFVSIRDVKVENQDQARIDARRRDEQYAAYVYVDTTLLDSYEVKYIPNEGVVGLKQTRWRLADDPDSALYLELVDHNMRKLGRVELAKMAPLYQAI